MLILALFLFTHSPAQAVVTPTDEQKDAFFEALRADDVAEVVALIDAGNGITANTSSYTETALTYAIKFDSIEMVKTLIAKGASVNLAQPVSSFTPLMVAAKHQKVEATQLLLDSQANVNLTGVFGRGPIHVAALHNSLDVARLLLKTNVETNTRGSLCPLAVASRQGHLEFVKLLLAEAKEKPSTKCFDSAKNMAKINGHKDVLSELTGEPVVEEPVVPQDSLQVESSFFPEAYMTW